MKTNACRFLLLPPSPWEASDGEKGLYFPMLTPHICKMPNLRLWKRYENGWEMALNN